MNKLYGFLIILLSVWVVKLSFDVYTLENRKMMAFNQSLEQQNQRVATLYDQMIVLQGQQAKTAPENMADQNQQSAAKSNTSTSSKPTISQTQQAAGQSNNVPTNSALDLVQSPDASDQSQQQQYLYDRLTLVQANLQQQRMSVALEQVQNIRQKLVQEQPLPESLNTALIEALVRDQNSITVYIQQRTEHDYILQQQLQNIAQKLQPVVLDSKQSKWQWPAWLSIGRAEQIPDMQNRVFHYKELQLRLLLAKHALYSGQNSFYKAQIKEIIQDLSAYPDRNTHLVVANLQKLESMVLASPPQLSALALIHQ